MTSLDISPVEIILVIDCNIEKVFVGKLGEITDNNLTKGVKLII